MIRTFTLVTLFAISLFAVPAPPAAGVIATAPAKGVIPTPTCMPNCRLPWEN